MANKRSEGGQDRWTEEDQAKAAEKGQGAEIGGTHGARETPAKGGDKASQGSSGGLGGGGGTPGGGMSKP